MEESGDRRRHLDPVRTGHEQVEHRHVGPVPLDLDVASVPEAATATTSMSACRDRIASRASLIRVSSSAMTIRIAGAGESGDAGSSGYPGCLSQGGQRASPAVWAIAAGAG